MNYNKTFNLKIKHKVKKQRNKFYNNDIFYPFQIIKKILIIGMNIALYYGINKAVY